jgi:hypothetical protein
MIGLFKWFLMIGFMYGICQANDVTGKVTCRELGLSFTLPSGFTPLDSAQMDAYSKRGEKAIQETFDKEILQGWQPVCLHLQDSFKRTVLLTAITVKEAIAQNGSTDKFINHTFKDGNDFIIQRFKSKADIDIDEEEAAKQTELTIGGLKVRKNAFTFIYGGRLLFFSRYYFFEKNGKLFLLSFTGSPKANDNEEVVHAIESAKTL